MKSCLISLSPFSCILHSYVICPCRAIYHSYEDVAWLVGDNNGMPQDPDGPLSDLAQSMAQTEGPQQNPPPPPPTSSGPDSDDSHSSGNNNKRDSISSRVQNAIWQAARMDSVGEAEQAKQDTRWQQTTSLQTIALDEHDLPYSTDPSPPHQVRLLYLCISLIHLNKRTNE